MKMASGLKRARFGERLNRFLARVEVDGKETLVHVPNSGRMRELFVPDATVYVSPGCYAPGRKTAFDLRLVLIDGVLVSCDSRLPPSLVAEAQRLGRLAEFAGYSVIERERTFGESRLDLCFSGTQGSGVRGDEVGDAGPWRKSTIPGCSDYARDEARSGADEGSGRRDTGRLWYSWCRGMMRHAFRLTGMRTRSLPRRWRRLSGRESGYTPMGAG